MNRRKHNVGKTASHEVRTRLHSKWRSEAKKTKTRKSSQIDYRSLEEFIIDQDREKK